MNLDIYEFDKTYEIYKLCQKYSYNDLMVVEPSIKISHNKLNNQRFTVPINLRYFNRLKIDNLCDELCYIVGLLEVNQLLKEYIFLSLKNFKGDLIFGYDWQMHTFKIYLDQIEAGIECLEMPLSMAELKIKNYGIIPVERYFEITNGFSPIDGHLFEILGLCHSNYRLVYEVMNLDEGYKNYHMMLKHPYKLGLVEKGELSEYFNIGTNLLSIDYFIYAISFVSNMQNAGKIIESLTIYVRPNNIITKSIALMAM